MIAAFDSMRAHGHGGTLAIFDASQGSSDDFGTQEQNPVGDETWSATCEHLGIQSTIPKAHPTPNTIVR